MMNGPEKSDSVVVAVKPANKAGQPATEWAEPRTGTKGSTEQPHTRRTQSRDSVLQGLDRVRGKWLKSVVTGYSAYHAVPTNIRALRRFRYHVMLSGSGRFGAAVKRTK